MPKQMYNILIPDRLAPPADVEQKVFGADTRIIVAQAIDSNQIDDAIWAECDGILAWHDLKFDAPLLDKLLECKVIVRVGVGFDNVDLMAAAERKISVCTVPDYGVNDVADHAMGMLLALVRGLIPCNELARNGEWNWGYASGLHRLTGEYLGIIGLGRIGGALARRAQAFGLNVLFYDPYQPVGIEKSWGLERCWTLGDIAERCRYISIHTPLTEETRRLIGSDFFARCKLQPIIINTARGPIVDLDALFDALVSDKVFAAGLDVLMEEPPDRDIPLIKAWRKHNLKINQRLIITPHCAFCNVESLEEMRRKAAEEAVRILTHQNPRSCVNRNF
jgi:lactate dehydrogenase-like 2-hydroxyacid dehydrogenase